MRAPTVLRDIRDFLFACGSAAVLLTVIRFLVLATGTHDIPMVMLP